MAHVGGAHVAPSADATINPRIHGLVGSAVSYPSELKMSVIRTPQLHEYHPLCYRADDKEPVSLAAINLHPGWNLVTQTIDQQTRSFLVFSGESQGQWIRRASIEAGEADDQKRRGFAKSWLSVDALISR